MALRHLAFLTPGTHPEDDPRGGLEATLRLFEIGEALGYDSAWVRQRHLERSVSSAVTLLAAASQRTRRIGLGVAVIQMGYEQPFRLAEELATADALAGGRLQVGVSAGAPPHAALLARRLNADGPAGAADHSHARVERLRAELASPLLGDADTYIESAAGRQRPRLQPIAAGLADRLWYGAGSLHSAEWAGRARFNLLIGNIVSGEGSDDFATVQLQHLAVYRSHWSGSRPARVALGRVVVPLDGAEAPARRRYLDYAASRVERTRQPQGPRRTLYAPDLVGHSDEILRRLRADPVLAQVTELRIELPYDLALAAYQQILADVARHIAPALGWRAGAADADAR